MFYNQTKRAIVALFIYPEFSPCRVLLGAWWSNICLFTRLRNPAQFPHNRRFLPHNLPPKTRTFSFFFPHPVRRPVYRVNKTVSRTGWVVAHLWILFSGLHCNFYPTTENVRRVISIKIAKFLWNKPGKLVSINRAACGLSSCFDVTAVSS